MSDNKLLIAIPTYNERENVPIIYTEIKKIKPDCAILFIDDNSPDKTREAIEKLKQNDKMVHSIYRPAKLGLGTAHVAAFDYAQHHNFSHVLTMDADLTHDPKYIPAMLDAGGSADIVIGSRYADGASMSGWGRIRLPFTYFWRNMIKYGIGMPYDCTGAFRLYRVSCLDPRLYRSFNSKGFSFNLEALYKLKKKGARITEIPIQARSRINGESKLSIPIMYEVLTQYFTLLFDRMFY